MPEPRSIDIHFPKKGIDLSRPAGEMPLHQGPNYERHYSCADAVNVCSWDVIQDRQRGGSRTGFSKWIAPQVTGVRYIVQGLDNLVGSGYDPPGGGVQASMSGRVVTLVAVAQGNVRVANPGDASWTTPTNSTSQTPPLNASGLIYSAPMNQKLHFADGLDERVKYDPATNTLNDWTATSGTMPEDSDNNGPRLICLWRSRIIQSGIIGDPQNIFGSAVALPNNWDYSPTNPSATDAWALNLTDQGEIGDVITGLVPCTDDVMVVLGDHSIHKMVGDPLSGGSVELVSDAIGGAFGYAWCKGPDGSIYFFANMPGVYVLPPRAAGQPQRISHQIDPLLKDVDTGNDVIRLFWDDLKHGFWLFITSSDGTEGNHWFYEMQRPDGSGGGWYRVVFANQDHNPFCGCIVDGNDAGDRALVLGASDGYVRKSDPTATDDDGTPIESYVLIGPILTKTGDEMTLIELQGDFGQGSADVQFDLLKGYTAEEALDASPLLKVRDVFSAGRGYTKLVNRSFHAGYIKLSCPVTGADPTDSAQWAMEKLRATIIERGPIRRRGKT